MSKRFNVIYQGSLLEGFDEETVIENLMQVFNISQGMAEKIIAKPGLVLKKEITSRNCQVYLDALNKAGLQVNAVPSESDEALDLEIPDIETIDTGFMDDDTAAAPISEDEEIEVIPFEFKGRGFEFFRIWIVNLLLSLITLGIYSAWAKVRRRRYLYGSTSLDETAFEYLADPLKILKGRIIVVVLAAVYGAASEFFPLYSLAFVPVILILIPWLVIRSLAFNARNSAHRNVRFGFDATYLQAARVFLLWPLLGILTLGLLMPYALFRQKAFLVDHHRYGTSRFTFHASAWDYYALFLKTGLIVLAGAAIGGTVYFFAMVTPYLMFAMFGIYGLGILLYFIIASYYTVQSTNLLLGSVSLQEHELIAELRFLPFFWILLSNTIALALTLGLFYPWAIIRTLNYKLNNLEFVPYGDLETFVAAEEKETSALGEEMSDFMDFDFGI